MMYPVEYQIAAAFLVDLLAGDPRFLPHPVRAIGWLAAATERTLRSMRFLPLRIAGVTAVILVVGGTVALAYALLLLCGFVHPLLQFTAGIVMLYFSIASRDLADHAYAVLRSLAVNDIDQARRSVSMIVGRDTSSLDEQGIAQAAVESVAENTVDGVTAPLFYALLFGPVGALAYKAVNTLDSSFGYKNERYLEFGWASARFDDLVNFFPSRLTVPCIAAAAGLMGLRYRDVLPSVRSTAGKHASPNAGYPEAAFAGALGVRFGGPRSYGGVVTDLPYLGIAENRPNIDSIKQAVVLMLLSSGVFLVTGVLLRLVVQAAKLYLI